jgi:Ankyrin repeats (3 copies)
MRLSSATENQANLGRSNSGSTVELNNAPVNVDQPSTCDGSRLQSVDVNDALQSIPTPCREGGEQRTPNSTQSPVPADWRQDGSLSTFLQTVKQVATFGSMTFHVNRLSRCNGDCDCECSTRWLFQSPRALNQVLGQLFIGYAGLPVFKADCPNQKCTNQYRRQMQVSYTFPGWMLLKTVNVAAAMTHNNEPSLGLTVKNRVAPTDATEDIIFTFARNGNVGAIIDLFKQRKASPNDVSAEAGQTPLHFALELGHIETCRFLLNIGIDLYAKDDKGYSDAREVSSLILARSLASRAWNAESVFQKITCEHAELWDFTFIHSVIVGILHVDLQSALDQPEQQANIDKPDNYGRTPLNWVARRGDSAAIQILLRAGASISTRDGEQKLPSTVPSGPAISALSNFS